MLIEPRLRRWDASNRSELQLQVRPFAKCDEMSEERAAREPHKAVAKLSGLAGDSAPTYDQRGNLVSRTASGNIPWKELYYTYDHENRLTCVQTDTYYTPESYRFKVEFVYDGQGRMRIKRNYIWSGDGWYGSGGETRYLYDGMLIVQERDAGNVPTVTYTGGRDLSGTVDGAGGIGGLLARSHGYSSGSWAYHNFYHSDGNGNVTALVNSGGTLQASYIYDPYGRYLSGTGTLLTSNVMRFSSKPWVSFLSSSATSGLYYYGYRFYEPYLQRWLNRDLIEDAGFWPLLNRNQAPAVGETGNAYEYLRNKPLNSIDPAGLEMVATTSLAVYLMCECGTGPNDLHKASSAQALGMAIADAHYPGSAGRNQHAAMRHCVASAVLAGLTSCETAECLGTKREDWQNEHAQTYREGLRAKNNNRIGRRCAGCSGPNADSGWVIGPARAYRLSGSVALTLVIECCRREIEAGRADTANGRAPGSD